MPKTLVVGDLHGQYEIAEAALQEGFPVVFLGDYLDSWYRSPEDQVKTLMTVLNAVKEGKAVALIGNHEMSYLDPHCQCGGWSRGVKVMVDLLDLSILKDYYWCEDFLLTHAGISDNFLKAEDITLEEYLESGWFETNGRIRGGSRPYGGLRWGDWRDFKPIEGVKQVFGHTRDKEVREIDGNYCIDVLEDVLGERIGLLIEDGNAEIYKF